MMPPRNLALAIETLSLVENRDEASEGMQCNRRRTHPSSKASLARVLQPFYSFQLLPQGIGHCHCLLLSCLGSLYLDFCLDEVLLKVLCLVPEGSDIFLCLLPISLEPCFRDGQVTLTTDEASKSNRITSHVKGCCREASRGPTLEGHQKVVSQRRST